ncbi:hypothetical protein SB766_21020 [Pseudomonas sp. SIMBA_077]
MPVRLDLLPQAAPRPAPIRLWLWFALLVVFLVVGAGWVLLFATPPQHQSALGLWAPGVGVPLLVWSALAFVRACTYIGQQQVALGWDQAREEALSRQIRCGRRSLQVLGASLYSALRAPGQSGAAQLQGLLDGNRAIKAQATRVSDAAVRHSRLASGPSEALEDVVLDTLQAVLGELSVTLEKLPVETPLALLLEVKSGLPDNLFMRVWREAWSASGIRQPTVSVEGSGLAAVDLWLDRRINDQAVLMVIALQFASDQPAAAEVAAGLLLGNRLTQTTLTPLAYLHRPELAREPGSEHVLYAARLALDWVPLAASGIGHIWRSGINAQQGAAITAVLNQLSMPAKSEQKLCDLDACLGHAGCASPWLAIAAATNNLARGAGPQFIFSAGSSVETDLWSTVMTPAPALSK